VIVWSPLASGFLTDGFSVDSLEDGDFRRSHRFAELELESLRDALRGDGRRSAAQGAIAFVLSHPAVTGAIVGVRNEREGAELAQTADLRLTPDEVAAIGATV
jgi:aryl-alcohol dehydrogenase-like predicted oxidoreductase